MIINPHDVEMHRILQTILDHGEVRGDRTGDGTISVFGDIHAKFDLRLGFPAVTSKYLHYHSVKHELAWMLSGDTNIRYLKENKVRIWDDWIKPGTAEYRMLEWGERVRMMNADQQARYSEATAIMRQNSRSDSFVLETQNSLLNDWKIPDKVLIAGELGPVYGSQWRYWEDRRTIPFNEWYVSENKYLDMGYMECGTGADGVNVVRVVDQISKIEQQLRDEKAFQNGDIKKHAAGRRIILSGWNVAMVDEMALPPCHTLAQWYVSSTKCEKGNNYLDCKLYMRSNDAGLGKSFNIAQYALLTHMFAHVIGLTPRYYFHDVGDAHIYLKHVDAIKEWLTRPSHKAPTLVIEGEYASVLDIPASAVSLEGYEHSGKIDMAVSV